MTDPLGCIGPGSRTAIAAAVLAAILIGCGADGDKRKESGRAPARHPTAGEVEWFADHSGETGLDFVHVNGRPYTRQPLDADWILERFPPDGQTEWNRSPDNS